MKELVKRNFSVSAKAYEKHAIFQKIIGEKLLKRVFLFNPPLPILDVGCGTGSLLKNLKFYGLDLSLEMTKNCSRFGICVCADAEKLPFRNEVFPTAFSNFSLQWTNLNLSFQEISRVLKKRGFFFLSIPVAGSLNTLFSCWKKISGRLPLFKFPEEKLVFKSFKTFFEIIEFERIYVEKEFESPRKALKAITGIGAKNPYGTASFKEAKKFRELFSKKPKVEFKVLIITGKRR
jgi:malonyl-CoA O-methyltransferase